MKKVAIHTLGCKLNFSESSEIGSRFIEQGFDVTDFDKAPDVYVFNTCSVTENAEKDCRQAVRKALRRNPDAYIIVLGCYSQLRPEDIAAIEGVDLVLGTKEKFRIDEFAGDFSKKESAQIHISDPEEFNDDFHPAASSDADARTRAFLKIQDGCDYKCSFCTIPAARGKSRSINTKLAVERFTRLLEEGYKEVILTGVNIGDFGRYDETDLLDLLKKLIKIEGDYRIRLSSIEPNLLTDKLIEFIMNEEKLCSHFHIPLQSGSPSILKLMRRRYKIDRFISRIEKINSYSESAGIGIDVITGFPGETEEDFLETYNLLRDLDYSYLHVFSYSERPGTSSADAAEKNDPAVIKERTRKLREIGFRKKKLYYQNAVGRRLNVLFESAEKNGMMEGFSSDYIRVAAPFDASRVNNFDLITITSANDYICRGKRKN